MFGSLQRPEAFYMVLDFVLIFLSIVIKGLPNSGCYFDSHFLLTLHGVGINLKKEKGNDNIRIG